MASSSSKTYVLVANDIRNALYADYTTESAQFAIAALARDLAQTFKRDNSNFRYDTFYEACGLDLHGAIPV